MFFTQRVRDHGHGAVNQGSVTQSKVAAGAQISEGHLGHRLIATGQDDLRRSPAQLLRGGPDGLQAATTQPIHVESRRAVGQAGS